MNRERCKELLPIIQAFAEGKEIQGKCAKFKTGVYSDWDKITDLESTILDDPDWELRIKPEPMEIWVNVYPRIVEAYRTKDDALDNSFHGVMYEAKHFREVTE